MAPIVMSWKDRIRDVADEVIGTGMLLAIGCVALIVVFLEELVSLFSEEN